MTDNNFAPLRDLTDPRVRDELRADAMTRAKQSRERAQRKARKDMTTHD